MGRLDLVYHFGSTVSWFSVSANSRVDSREPNSESRIVNRVEMGIRIIPEIKLEWEEEISFISLLGNHTTMSSAYETVYNNHVSHSAISWWK